MTFSLAARCRDTGAMGTIVTSSSICVTSRCAFVSEHGAVMSQNVTQPALGIKALKLLAQGLDAVEALQQLIAEEPYPEYRQLSIVDAKGGKAFHDGVKALGIVGRAEGENSLSGGNMLANEGVPQAVIEAFEQSTGPLAERLVNALAAGLEQGGEAGPIHSAGVRVAQPGYDWPVVDLRVDWSDHPIDELRTLWKRYQPELEDYVTRADNPAAAPSYGVPGDE